MLDEPFAVKESAIHFFFKSFVCEKNNERNVINFNAIRNGWAETWSGADVPRPGNGPDDLLVQGEETRRRRRRLPHSGRLLVEKESIQPIRPQHFQCIRRWYHRSWSSSSCQHLAPKMVLPQKRQLLSLLLQKSRRKIIFTWISYSKLEYPMSISIRSNQNLKLDRNFSNTKFQLGIKFTKVANRFIWFTVRILKSCARKVTVEIIVNGWGLNSGRRHYVTDAMTIRPSVASYDVTIIKMYQMRISPESI